MVKGLCILGSTGSVGRNCLRVTQSLEERFQVASLAAGTNLELLAQQVAEFHPRAVSVGNPDGVKELRNLLSARGHREPVQVVWGPQGQVEVATLPEVGIVVSAAHGITGLLATYAAVCAGKRVGLANKESLVVAGEIVMRAAQEHGAQVLPIDSEHCALHQCLRSGRPEEVKRLILTASGGPFLETPGEVFESITPDQALQHPIWRMGGRITIDSATLMNKGLEIIEAHWLFGLEPARIDVLVHPESIIHSMIEFKDGSVMAQLSIADMRLPIQYALTYPERISLNGDTPALDLVTAGRLRFFPPDLRRFPCLELGREAIQRGGGFPCALNAADEVAVERFLSRRLSFADIPRVVEGVLKRTSGAPLRSMDDVLACDLEARQLAGEIASGMATPGD
ncbi:MAG: 1-deoxy-D-xylulose-5-phosphate reductoisomerase [Terriglobia bacterium]